MFENIHEATRWLEATLRPQGDGRRLRAAVATLSGKPQLALLLRSLLADRQSMAVAAAQSYTHPLGFDKLTLAILKDLDYQLRLHIWWPDRENAIEDVHNHRFAFASAVLDGALKMQTFERADDGARVQEYRSPLGTTVGVSLFRHLGDANLACTATSHMPAGSVYRMSARTLHRILIANAADLTATLFLQGPIMQPWTAVFSDHAVRQRPTIARPTMAPGSFGERVAAYVERLENSAAA